MDHYFPRFSLCLLIQLLLVFCYSTSYAAESANREECLERLLTTAPDTMTFGEARKICKREFDLIESSPSPNNTANNNPVENRLNVDESNVLKPFTLMSHRNNYFLFAAHNFKDWRSPLFERQYGAGDSDQDDTEVQFQLSIKSPLAVNLFDKKLDIFAGYTVRSFWQLYNSDNSSPFRETNHEPEIWAQFHPKWQLFGFKNTVNAIGINHMSNGQGGTLSRSWNRIYGAVAFERDNFAFLLRPWYRIQEDSEDDDNPDITDFYGHGELWLAYKYNDHTLSLMTRNNLESGFSDGAFQLEWSFPLFNYPFIKGYIQYFSGYGESLIDYNRYVNKIGVGLQLTGLL